MAATPEPLRGLFCGAGHFARIQLEAWREIPGARIVALYNRTAERARLLQEQFEIADIGTDFAVLLKQTRPDFVDICTAAETHLPLVQAAARHGVPILCQKPLAPRIADAVALVDAVTRHGVRLMANENWRWRGWYRELKRLVDSGAIGTPQHARFVLRPGDGWGEEPYPLQPFFREMERFVLLEVGGHYLDTMQFLLGPIAALHCVTRRRNPRIRAEDAALVVVEFGSGATGVFDADRTACTETVRPPTNGHAVIEGSAGTLRLDEEGAIFLLRRGGRETKHDYAVPAGYRGGSAIGAQRHFIECLRSGAPFETEGAEYLRVERMVEMCYRSAASGSKERLEVAA
jgi:predicted dehydrogenase